MEKIDFILAMTNVFSWCAPNLIDSDTMAIKSETKTPALTDQQNQFVAELVSTGCTPTEAARRAGYADGPLEGWRLMRKPHVLAAVKHLRERMVGGHLANVAVATLMDVMQDRTCPASARVSAARTVFEAAGMFNTEKSAAAAQAEKRMEEMDAAELAAFIRRCDEELADRTSLPRVITAQN